MKKFAPAIVLALTALLVGNAIAGETPKTKADCEKAHMTWDEASGKCVKK